MQRGAPGNGKIRFGSTNPRNKANIGGVRQRRSNAETRQIPEDASAPSALRLAIDRQTGHEQIRIQPGTRLRSTLETQGSHKPIDVIISTNASCCLLRGSQAVAGAFHEELARAGLTEQVNVRLTGCLVILRS